MSRVIIIGGGVIGLSLAYELVCRNHEVTIVERDQLGRKSSWAGAGIFPPVNAETAIHPLEKLESLSTNLHLRWSEQLREETGIDNQLLNSGGLYLARTVGERAALIGLKLYWNEREIEFENLTQSLIRERIPDLNVDSILEALFVPAEYQVRNPCHLQALQKACCRRGVRLIEDASDLRFNLIGSHVKSIQLSNELLEGEFYCVAAGAWSQQLLETTGFSLPMTPVRGQVALFQLGCVRFTPIVNEGTRYLVPRSDGNVIAGATIEEVGFDSQTQPADIAELVQWAQSLVSACNPATLVKAWAGLRPGTYDGFPYLGFLSNTSNILVATGHFKSGLHLSTGTADVIADLVEGKKTAVDLTTLGPNRVLNTR